MPPLAERLYLELEPIGSPHLLVLTEAVTAPYEELYLLTQGGAGWSAALDVDSAPVWLLPWLAQLVGVRVTQGVDEATQRTEIRTAAGFKRGTVLSIVQAAQTKLTGTKLVVVRERTPTPYSLQIRTYTDQTPDPAAVEAAIRTQKPGGIVLDYAAITGQDWATLIANYPAWSNVISAYTTWSDVVADTP